MLHLKSTDYNYLKDKLELGGLNEIDTDLHIKFYDDIKTNNTFKSLYCKFIKDIYKHFFPNEKYMIFSKLSKRSFSIYEKCFGTPS